MLPLPAIRAVCCVLPDLVSGRSLHRRGLAELAAGAPAEADRWFEAAAALYRRELAVEPLARLRVHQLMARASALPPGHGEAAAMLEVVRRLNRLDRLESLDPPHALIDARVVLARWIERAAGEPDAPREPAAVAAPAA